MTTLVMYYNPKCSKCRGTKAKIEARGLSVEIIEYLSVPLSVDDLKAVVAKLPSASVDEIIRNKEALYHELKLDQVSDEEKYRALVSHPTLLERPIVIYGEKACVCRPPERVDALLDGTL